MTVSSSGFDIRNPPSPISTLDFNFFCIPRFQFTYGIEAKIAPHRDRDTNHAQVQRVGMGDTEPMLSARQPGWGDRRHMSSCSPSSSMVTAIPLPLVFRLLSPLLDTNSYHCHSRPTTYLLSRKAGRSNDRRSGARAASPPPTPKPCKWDQQPRSKWSADLRHGVISKSVSGVHPP